MQARWTILAGGVALMALALATPMHVDAQNNPGRRGGRGNFDPSEMFDRMDINGDGSLDATEFRGGEERLKEADTNGDGKVSKEELSAAFQARMAGGQREGGPEGRPGPGVDRFKEELGLSDDEWAVLKPRIEKVIALQSEMRGGGRGNTASMPEVEALRTALENPEATNDEITQRVAELRKAREEKQAELKTARETLRELLTPRQEALLVLNGLLD
ncbi:MAG: hypothetical protein PWP23_817 [Candidatus Sumerlaeota bacterium]|nr:hypothetical protein [Candidatus Sumerlaeota bacterium]